MPKKAKPETPEEQSERFKKEAQKLIDAGELSPTAGEEALDKLVSKQKPNQTPL
jgi:hypothetical protein